MLADDGKGLLLYPFENYAAGNLDVVREMLLDEATKPSATASRPASGRGGCCALWRWTRLAGTDRAWVVR